DDHVVDRAAGAAHQLRLGGRRYLVVHAAQGAGQVVVGDVGLRDRRLEPVLLELTGAEGAGEEAARVGALLELDDVGAGQRGGVEDHAVAASCMRASSQKNCSSICLVASRCLSIFRRVKSRDSKVSLVRPM